MEHMASYQGQRPCMRNVVPIKCIISRWPHLSSHDRALVAAWTASLLFPHVEGERKQLIGRGHNGRRLAQTESRKSKTKKLLISCHTYSSDLFSLRRCFSLEMQRLQNWLLNSRLSVRLWRPATCTPFQNPWRPPWCQCNRRRLGSGQRRTPCPVEIS